MHKFIQLSLFMLAFVLPVNAAESAEKLTKESFESTQPANTNKQQLNPETGKETGQDADDLGHAIPEWLIKEWQVQVGNWKTSNSQYQSENEPFSHYIIEWTWGTGKQSVHGQLMALNNGEKTGNFWTFVQYWDPVKAEARVIQLGHGGRVGDGSLMLNADGNIETIQTFSAPGVEPRLEKHLNQMSEAGLTTSSFNQDKNGEWQPQRSYLWIKQAPENSD